jgi:hypothetical protein
MRRARTARLVASWIGRRVSGGISSTARLLTTVPTPHDAAARIRARMDQRGAGELGMAKLRARWTDLRDRGVRDA